MSCFAQLALIAGAPVPDRWASWRWLATPDERVLWAILLSAAALAVWGGWSAYAARQRPARRDPNEGSDPPRGGA